MAIPEFDAKLEKYADAMVRVGLNLQPGQRLLIGTFGFTPGVPLEAAPLVRAVVKKAYQAGACYVEVIWDDPAVTLLRYQYAPRDSFDAVPLWRRDATVDFGEQGDAILTIYAADPDLLAGQDPALIQAAQQATYKARRPVSQLIEKNKMSWLVASAPVMGWANKVLPDVPASQRIDRLWEAIFTLCRIDQPDPVASWQAHVQEIQARYSYLNSKQYTALKYAGPGTDLTIGLPRGHMWRGGSLKNEAGIDFVPNMPTEEVFTLPHKDRVEGTVAATMPLNLSGTLIEDFALTFEAGRVVNISAARGADILTGMLDTDDGARRLGEVALVPHSSPISQSGLLFYNTLYDENASCHIALGNAYKFSLAGGETMSDADFDSAGGNQSLIHTDFMIGSGRLDIDGVTAEGSVEPVMRSGEWAFHV